MKQIVGTAVLALMTASLSACGEASHSSQPDVASASETASTETSPSADASTPSPRASLSPTAPASRPSRTTDVAPSKSALPKPSSAASGAAVAALKLNQTQRGRDLDTTVYEVSQPAKAPPYATLDTPGAIWVTVRAKQCVHRDAQRPHQAGWTDYVGIDQAGLRHPAASSSWAAWPPKPQYPQGKKIAPGGCAAGWMLFGVTSKQQFSRIGLDDGRGSLVAQWTVR